METRQHELYSSVLSDAVVDWGPGEEWVNSGTHEGEEGVNRGTSDPRVEESVQTSSHGQDSAQTFQNGGIQTERRATRGEEWGESPTGEDGIKTSQHALEEWGLSENWDMDPTWDMQPNATDRGRLTAGFQDCESLREADEDLVSEVNLDHPVMTEEEREEIHQELAKLEEEISTLKQVLCSKEKQHSELKHKLGITPLSELKNNLSRGLMDMQSSTAFKKTSETLTTAGHKTSAAFNTLGSAITRKLGDMRSNAIGYSIRQSMSMPTMRNSPSFKSFEEKVENTVSTIKTKVGASGTEGSFQDVLSSAANATPQDTPTNDMTDTSRMPC